MAFIIKSPSEFTVDIEQWNRETLADGPEMAKVIEKLLNNEVYNKELGEQAKGKILSRITIPAAGWTNLTYTVEDEAITSTSIVQVGYAFDSILIAQKANIRGRTETGRLILTAKKLPVADLIIDDIRILNIKEE